MDMLVSKILPVAAGFIPFSSFLFGEAALIAEFSVLAGLAVENSTGFGFGENLGWGVIDDRCRSEGSFDAFLDELDDFDAAFVSAIERGDFELVSDFESSTCFQVLSSALHLSGGAIVRGLRSRLVETSCPEPFVSAHGI